MIITTVTQHGKTAETARTAKTAGTGSCEYENPKDSPDWEYMKQCSLIDKNPPASWSKFADTASLVKALYTDLMNNPNEVKNVYNLSVALLRHWRYLTEK